MNLQELFRYGAAGLLAFSTDFSLLYLLTEYGGIHFLVSNLIGYSSGLVLAYALNSNWVFSARRYENRYLEFALFAGVVVTGLAISEGVMFALVASAEAHYMYAKLVAGLFVGCANYAFRKYWLFAPAPISR